jgi:sterol desaturase/sphingolipid hydroxylase (fatty acid hydroxylase superfamily)
MGKAQLKTATHVATRFDEKVYRGTVARMFSSDFVEPFSKVHPALPAIIFLPVVAWFGWEALMLTPFWQIPLALIGGGLLWSLVEYTLHRFVFHIDQSTPVGHFFHFYTHGIHHSYPDDFYRLVMIPTLSIPLAIGFYYLFGAVFPAAFLPGFFAGFVLGYLTYDYTHFATHNIVPPRHPKLRWIATIMKEQRRRHMVHHYKEHEAGYGVSTALWDVVFGTKISHGSTAS